MSMSVGGIGAYGGINPYEAYKDRFSGGITAEDAAEMADAVGFEDSLNPPQDVSGIQPLEPNKDLPVRIEPAEESSASTSDLMRGELSRVMEDMLDIQGSLWGFSMRREIPMVEQL